MEVIVAISTVCIIVALVTIYFCDRLPKQPTLDKSEPSRVEARYFEKLTDGEQHAGLGAEEIENEFVEQIDCQTER